MKTPSPVPRSCLAYTNPSQLPLAIPVKFFQLWRPRHWPSLKRQQVSTASCMLYEPLTWSHDFRNSSLLLIRCTSKNRTPTAQRPSSTPSGSSQQQRPKTLKNNCVPPHIWRGGAMCCGLTLHTHRPGRIIPGSTPCNCALRQSDWPMPQTLQNANSSHLSRIHIFAG